VQRRGTGRTNLSSTNRDGTIYRTIYRGRVGSGRLEVWQGPRAGNDGRGIDVDDHGRVFVAGGPSGEVRVFSPSGALLAELPTRAAGSYLNDIWIARDGAAYVTDSSLPIVWRVGQHHGRWSIERWLDVSETITYTPALTDFDLGGIVSTPDGRYLLTSQGTTGRLCPGRSTCAPARSGRWRSPVTRSSPPTGSCCVAAPWTSSRTSAAR
jgi:Cu-Zn family superoxide dismutase